MLAETRTGGLVCPSASWTALSVCEFVIDLTEDQGIDHSGGFTISHNYGEFPTQFCRRIELSVPLD